jgi:hypothetical protein
MVDSEEREWEGAVVIVNWILFGPGQINPITAHQVASHGDVDVDVDGDIYNHNMNYPSSPLLSHLLRLSPPPPAAPASPASE